MVRKQSATSREGARRGLGQPSLRLANGKGRDREEVPVGELWPSAKSGLLPILFSQGALQIFTLLNGWETEYFVTTRNSDFSVHTERVIGTKPHPSVYIASVCFSSTTAELHKGDRGGMVLRAKNIYCLALYRRRFVIMGLRCSGWRTALRGHRNHPLYGWVRKRDDVNSGAVKCEVSTRHLGEGAQHEIPACLPSPTPAGLRHLLFPLPGTLFLPRSWPGLAPTHHSL